MLVNGPEIDANGSTSQTGPRGADMTVVFFVTNKGESGYQGAFCSYSVFEVINTNAPV